MAAIVKNRQSRFSILERLLIGLRCAHRDQCVLTAPYDLCRQPAHALQKIGQGGGMKTRLPRYARGLRARVLEGLELRGCPLATVELAKLGRGLRIVDTQVERRALGDHEDVKDLAFGWFYAQRRDQHHFSELSRVGGRHFGCGPSAERESDDVDPPEIH